MLERSFRHPKDMWARVQNGHLLYVPIVTVQGSDHAHIYLSGQVARTETGEIIGKGDMRAQIRKTCENIERGLAHVGADFSDVVRAVTYVTDIDEYYRCSDERYKFFVDKPCASTLIEISRLGHPDSLVEIEVDAIIETERLKR